MWCTDYLHFIGLFQWKKQSYWMRLSPCEAA
jgi:hypothetical protein